jgi:hypothetical protein
LCVEKYCKKWAGKGGHGEKENEKRVPAPADDAMP